MAFKLTNAPYEVDNTPIYRVDMEEGAKNLPWEAEAYKNAQIWHLS